jgi:hypothetical protein
VEQLGESDLLEWSAGVPATEWVWCDQGAKVGARDEMDETNRVQVGFTFGRNAVQPAAKHTIKQEGEALQTMFWANHPGSFWLSGTLARAFD